MGGQRQGHDGKVIAGWEGDGNRVLHCKTKVKGKAMMCRIKKVSAEKERTQGTHQSLSTSQMAQAQGQEIAAGLTDQQGKATLVPSTCSQKKKTSPLEEENRSSHDKALRVTKGARELCRQLQR